MNTLALLLAALPVWLWVVIIVWSLAWEGWALWIAARNKHIAWFIILLLVHTLGILEIIYIFFIARPLQKKRAAESSAGSAENK